MIKMNFFFIIFILNSDLLCHSFVIMIEKNLFLSILIVILYKFYYFINLYIIHRIFNFHFNFLHQMNLKNHFECLKLFFNYYIILKVYDI